MPQLAHLAHAVYFTRPAVWLTLLFVASRIVIFVCFAGENTDLGMQKEYITKIIAGQAPFREFHPEYPPLVFLYTGIPAIIDHSLQWYSQIFRVLTCAVDCGIWLMLLRFQFSVFSFQRRTPSPRPSPVEGEGARRAELNKPSHVWQCSLYILGTTALGPLIYDRIDLVLGAMLVVAVVALARGRENVFKLAIGTGIAFKLIPVIFVPMILAREWRRAPSPPFDKLTAGGPSPIKGEGGEVDGTQTVRPSFRRMGWTIALLALPTVLSFGAVMALGGWRIDKLFAFHAERPIQLESGSASVAMIIMMFGAPGTVGHDFGSFNLDAPYGKWLVAGSALLLAAVCAASAVMLLRRRNRWHGQETVPQHCETGPQQAFLLLMAAVLTAAMVLSKVLSPQYFLFLLPVLVLLPVPRDKGPAIANWLLIAAIYILTGLIFPWSYGDLVALKPAAEFMLILRNELLLGLAVSLGWRACMWTRRPAALQSGETPLLRT